MEEELEPLFQHQEECLAWMAQRKDKGGLVYLDPGMGKTRIGLEWICRQQQAAAGAPGTGRKTMVVVVVPNSLLIQWTVACRNYHLDNVLINPTVAQLRARQRAQRQREVLEAAHVLVLTTYTQLQTLYLRAMNKGGEHSFTWAALCKHYEEAAFVFDECHIFRNKKSKLFLALLQLTANSPKSKWCFSGTPVINWPKKDLASLTTIIGLAPLLKNKLHPMHTYVFSREKHLLDLPPYVEEIVECAFSPVEQQRYDTYRLTSPDNTLTKIHTLRYLCSNVVAKFRTIQQLLDDDGGANKMIVFSESVQSLERLKDFLARQNGGDDRHVSMYHGKMSPLDRDAALTEFAQNPRKVVCLLSIHCGGVGLNITCASKVVLLETQYAPAIEQQAADRVYRPGQTKAVQVYKLRMTESIETWVQGLQQCKSSALKSFKHPKLVSAKKIQKDTATRKHLFSQFVEKALDSSDDDDDDDDDDLIFVTATAAETAAAIADANFVIPDGEGEEEYEEEEEQDAKQDSDSGSDSDSEMEEYEVMEEYNELS